MRAWFAVVAAPVPPGHRCALRSAPKLHHRRALPCTMDNVQLILLTAVAGLVLILISTYLVASKNDPRVASDLARPTFLLVGANGAGKTGLFQLLTQETPNPVAPTVSSLEQNVGTIQLPFSNATIAKKYQLIDYPGHLKYSQLLRKLIVDQVQVKNVKGVVFVIDASSMSLAHETRLAAIAKTLLDLLSVTEKTATGVDFLFAVNKQDLFDARPVHKVKQMVEDELAKLVADQINTKGSVGGGSGIDVEDDADGDDMEAAFRQGESSREFWKATVGSRLFKFDMLEGNMDFIGGSVLKSAVDNWKNWFDEKAVNYGGM